MFRQALLVIVAALLATPVRADDRLVLVLDWFVNPNHAPIVVADAAGYFRDAGLAVEVIAPSDPNDPPKLVAAKRADLAISYQPSLQVQVGQGLPLLRVATLVASPLNFLLVLKDGPVQSIADLKGRRVGYSVGGFEDALLGAMLARHGLGLKDISLVNVNFSLAPSLMSGQTDAVIGAFRNFEPNQLAIAGKAGRGFFVEEEGVPAYDELVLVAHRDRVRDPRLMRFVQALERGVHTLLNRPEESWQRFVARDRALDDELNRRAWADSLRRFAASPGALDRGRYERFAAFLKARGLITQALPVDSYAVQIW